MGSSAGGVETLTRISRGLAPDLPASIFVVQHMSPTSHSVLPDLLRRAGRLPAKHAVDGEEIRPQQIYVAPPDLHMLVYPGRIALRRGPQENRTRPSLDPLFRSAAIAYGGRVIGVVLTGLLNDGTSGLIAIKRCGGLSVVQDVADATWPEMPRSALRRDHVDFTSTAAGLPRLLARLTREAAGQTPPIPPELIREVELAGQETLMLQPSGRPSPLTCPQCGGVLNEVHDDGAAQFRCQTGHAFSAEVLLSAQNDELERALDVAVRTHRERSTLFRRMQALSDTRGQPHAAAAWKAAADEAETLAGTISGALAKLKKPAADPEEPS